MGAPAERLPLMSSQERRWQQTPPPFTVYSEVYYCYGKLPQPSPALDRILQELLEQQGAHSATASRPRITLTSRDTRRRRAKAEIIAKRLEDQGGRPPRPRSLPPRPYLPPRRRSRSRSRPRPCSAVSLSDSRRTGQTSNSPPRERHTAVPCRPTKKPTPKRCPLPPPDSAVKPEKDTPSTSCKDQPPPPQQGPQESEYTYYSSEEEDSANEAKKLPDYPAGSLISRLLPTSTATAASSESGSYESSRGLRSVVTFLPQPSRYVHALAVAAVSQETATPSPRQHREPAANAGGPRQDDLKSPLPVCCPLDNSSLCLAEPAWAHEGARTWLTLVCPDAIHSAVKSAECARGDLLFHCARPSALKTAPSPVAGHMASPAAQPQAPPPQWRPRTRCHSCAATTYPKQPVSATLRQRMSVNTTYAAGWLTGTLYLQAGVRPCLADGHQVKELHAGPMDEAAEEKHPEHRRSSRPVNPRFLTGRSGARRHEPVFAEEVRSRGPPLTRFHPGLAASLPDELFEGLIPGPTTDSTPPASTASPNRARPPQIIEVEDEDSPREHTRAQTAGAATPTGPTKRQDSSGTAATGVAAAPEAENQAGQAETTPAPRGGRWLSLQRAAPLRPIDLDDDPPLKDHQTEILRPADQGKRRRQVRRRLWKVHALGRLFCHDGDKPGERAFSVPTGQSIMPGAASSVTSPLCCGWHDVTTDTTPALSGQPSMLPFSVSLEHQALKAFGLPSCLWRLVTAAAEKNPILPLTSVDPTAMPPMRPCLPTWSSK